MEKQFTDWGKKFIRYIPDKVLVSRVQVNNAYNSIIGQTTQLKMDKNVDGHFTKEDIQVANSIWKCFQHY